MSILKDSLKTIILSVLTLLLVGIAYAWTEPTDDPPSGNASAPLTVSGTAQSKAGGLVIDSLGIANTASNALTVAGGIKFSDGSIQTSAAGAPSSRGSCTWRNAGGGHDIYFYCAADEYSAGFHLRNEWASSEWYKHQYITDVYCCKIPQ